MVDKRMPALASMMLWLAAWGPVTYDPPPVPVCSRASTVLGRPADDKMAAVIGGATYPSPLSGVDIYKEPLQERGYTVVSGAPGDWPELGKFQFIVCHSAGCNAALSAPPGPRIILMLDPFLVGETSCPKGAAVYDYYNTVSFGWTTGEIPCAHNVPIIRAPSLVGHMAISYDVRIRDVFMQLLDQMAWN